MFTIVLEEINALIVPHNLINPSDTKAKRGTSVFPHNKCYSLTQLSVCPAQLRAVRFCTLRYVDFLFYVYFTLFCHLTSAIFSHLGVNTGKYCDEARTRGLIPINVSICSMCDCCLQAFLHYL